MKLYVLVRSKDKVGEYEVVGLVREESVAKQWQAPNNGVFEIDAGFGLFKGIEIKLRAW